MKTKPRDYAELTQNLALQNIQARSRMVMAYFMAQLMPWATDGDETTAGGSLLVLGSANVDEALRGYYTKYDCSAADLNPIGGVNKRDLKAFLEWAGRERGIGVLARVADAPPSAELTGAEGAQLDEEDMGMSYDELAALGYCRKVERCGPLSTFLKLRDRWADGRALTPSIRARGAAAPVTFDEQVAQKVKDFYFYHAINRHKRAAPGCLSAVSRLHLGRLYPQAQDDDAHAVLPRGELLARRQPLRLAPLPAECAVRRAVQGDRRGGGGGQGGAWRELSVVAPAAFLCEPRLGSLSCVDRRRGVRFTSAVGSTHMEFNP